MKDIAKQQERAGVDVANRVRKLLVEIRPVQQKYGLTDELMNLVLYSGAALVAIEYAKPTGVMAEHHAAELEGQ